MDNTKSIVDAIEAGNTALAEHRKLADQIIEKQNKGEAGLSELITKQHGFFEEMSTNFKAVETALAKMNRPNLKSQADAETNEAVEEYRATFKGFIRGTVDDREMKTAESKARTNKALAITTNSGADGGYAMPKVIDDMIADFAVNISPVRARANVVTIGTNDYHKLVNLKGMASGWVGETAARPATNTPTLVDVPIKANELYANPQATQVMLDDVFFDAETWIASELAQEFARAEGAAFIVGDGSNKPLGFLAGTPTNVVDGSTRPFGTLQYVPSGAAGAFATSNPADVMFALVGALKAAYRANASFMMAKSVLFTASAFKDSTGRYIYNPVMAPGVPANLLGYPIDEAEDMPGIAANSLSIAFGDFKQAYTIVDRKGLTTIRDPYSNKPYVGFYTVKRVGGALVNSEALKVVKFSAT